VQPPALERKTKPTHDSSAPQTSKTIEIKGDHASDSSSEGVQSLEVSVLTYDAHAHSVRSLTLALITQPVVQDSNDETSTIRVIPIFSRRQVQVDKEVQGEDEVGDISGPVNTGRPVRQAVSASSFVKGAHPKPR
jgi:hypothetical protein